MSTYPLAMVAPIIRRIRLPFARDGIVLMLMAVTMFFLGIDTYLAHMISGTIVPREWTPILFGPVAGVLLLIAGAIARRQRMTANILATVVFLACIVVGVLGSYFHIIRAILPDGPTGGQVTLSMLVWAPPLLGPITFALVGITGMSAAWQEETPGSGVLVLPGNKHLRMPISKSRAYFFLIAMWSLATVISSVLDHARSNFTNPLVWIPTVGGIFATAVILALGYFEKPTHADYLTYVITMLVLMLVGVVGFGLHISQNLVNNNAIVFERFIRGAPLLGPLLFAFVGSLGLAVLMEEE